MKEGQDKIYYLVADSFAAAKDSPLLEIFKKKGVEVVLLSDPVDHLWVPELSEFNGIPLQSVSRGEVDLSKLVDGQDAEEPQQIPAETNGLTERIKAVLGEKVKAVRTTTRLTASPACLVVDEYGLDPSLKRLLQAAGQTIPNAKPILEINPDHAIINRMRNEADEKRFSDWAYMLLDQSVLSSGEQLEDPIRFVNRLNDLLTSL